VNLKIKTDGPGGSSVDFFVGGSFDRSGKLEGRDAVRAALKIRRAFEYDMSTRPDGYVYKTSAYTADKFGGSRAQAYERIGFSPPTGKTAGGNQYGIVKNGKLVPLAAKDYKAALKRSNQAAADALLNSFL
jgi:hypothetical protein